VECAIVLLLIVPLPVLWLISHTILYPTVIAAQKVRGPFRFQLLDFVALILQIQLVLAPILAWTSGGAVVLSRNLFLALGLSATVAMWLAAVRFLSKAGITQGLRRAVFILIYLPGTLAVLTLGPVALLALVSMIPNDWPFWHHPPREVIGGLAGVLALAIAAGFGLRKLGEWLVK
jgi:hypothetical protein